MLILGDLANQLMHDLELDDVTFIGIVLECNNAGLLEEDCQIFASIGTIKILS
ncbi:hypothetical protein TanjilG_16002 [Lupinus angustifolius]|uniref:Uncharacterized protein n=1 Tax=Lupinus angustifolius TaxID=3871 RepID=A0A4P1RH65_LUPAN|nr:hypothetical protein TanjilG_16002 [Lupinus angustifolius]